jgi:hypothetical protein
MKNLSPFAATPPALSHTSADRAYEGLTIAAMILLLGTLWAF